MDAQINNLVQELKENLQNSFNDFEGLYVYGSQAKGTAHKDSDIDVVILLKDNDRQKRNIIWDIASQLDYKYYDYGMSLDLHPMTREELERNYVFHNEVVNKGIFYAAA
ncbi:MAG: nucleotidyltransferase domain-containing protein [Endomicrobium sp.]|jgi:predicted nucleotidyltransferase|nr:nucleotidyltransferase domain-containing protein [Endomicrobium sp.]